MIAEGLCTKRRIQIQIKERCCNCYTRPGTAPSSTTGRRSSYRHLLGRLRVGHSLPQCVRDSDCWFGAWHKTMHGNPQHAQPKQWNTAVSVDQIGSNIAFQQIAWVHRGPVAARTVPRAPSLAVALLLSHGAAHDHGCHSARVGMRPSSAPKLYRSGRVLCHAVGGRQWVSFLRCGGTQHT